MTTAPTAAEVDSIADSYYDMAQNLLNDTYNNQTSSASWLAGYTQNDSTVATAYLPGDPTANFQAATICRGLVVSYANILVREYTCAWPGVPGSVESSTFEVTTFTANATEQSRVNTPSNWVSAP
jgi:hypothetical protein